MKTATDIRLESKTDPERSSTERQHGLRLVGVDRISEVKRPFTISISYGMFASNSAMRDVRSSSRVEGVTERSGEIGAEILDHSRLPCLAAGIVVAGALILGYLAIRRR